MDDLSRRPSHEGDRWLTPDDPLAGDPPGYLGAPPAGTRSKSGAWLVASGTIALVFVIGAIVVATRPSPGTDPNPAVDDGLVEQIAPAAPWDGKASLRLPVTITPNRDLVDGQEVTVTATGFPPNADLGVLMCTNQAVFAGIDACDINSALSSFKGFPITSDGQGNVSTRYRVSRYISVPGPSTSAAPTSVVMDDGSVTIGGTVVAPNRIDCATGDIDPDTWPSIIPPSPAADPGGFTCIVAIGMVSDYDKSGGAAVGFEGATFATFETAATTAPPSTDTTIPTPIPSPTPAPDDPAVGQPTPSTPGEPPTTVVVPPPATAPRASPPGAPSTSTTGPPPGQKPPPGPGPTTTTLLR